MDHVRAGEYAQRIPAAACYGLHAASQCEDPSVANDWAVTMPGLPLEVVQADNVAAGIVVAVGSLVATPVADEVIVVLARRSHGPSGRTLWRLVTCLQQLDRVAPIVLPRGSE
ncbi:MAG: hypothetical protein M3Z46_03330 [Actinomycetota bacterium]|nr:hypothetical protein [Actinomycetota bacterium]